MVGLDGAQENIAALGVVTATKGESADKEATGTVVSFADLLKNVKSDDTKEAKNSLLLLLSDQKAPEKEELVSQLSTKNKDTKEQKSSALEALLSSVDESDIELEDLQKDLKTINPQLTTTLSSSDLKKLIGDAKNYLKDQITQTEGYKKSEIKNLPKTLSGLVDVAKKFNIDISKITMQEVAPKTDTTSPLKMVQKTPLNGEQLQEEQPQLQERSSDTKSLQKASQQATTALFKKESSSTISTQEMVTVKVSGLNKDQAGADPKNTKKREEDTLKLLLQGKESLKGEGGSSLTSDFSVTSAKVIAPTLKQQREPQSLESLLQGDQESSAGSESKSSSLQSTQTLKADSLEVKVNEAKQMVKYLSQDVKQAIDDYKAPFTRVKVQLNPQQLGEIELTVVQRGKNLHVNLSSNNAAINTLSMNANDLKQQLQNNGINNASLNFSSNSQGGEAASSGQSSQQQHNQQQAQREYNYFDQEDTNDEIVNSLEIIVPNYA